MKIKAANLYIPELAAFATVAAFFMRGVRFTGRRFRPDDGFIRYVQVVGDNARLRRFRRRFRYHSPNGHPIDCG